MKKKEKFKEKKRKERGSCLLRHTKEGEPVASSTAMQ